ncbi:MAG: DUF1415 domain-containing protein [Sphingobacteriales bacterium]|nr:DUF1415 domain-containing protein [Sphingobacteriales bacterium]
MATNETVINQTKKWITDVIIGCNFCPFAAKEMNRNTVHYQIENGTDETVCLELFLEECIRLDNDKSIETSFLIFPNAYEVFEDYLDLVDLAESILQKHDYEGVYQVASFHPDYQFAGTKLEDVENFTNRSIYPMLHLLREDSITAALEKYAGSGEIPEKNIDFARQKGIAYMKALRDACL